MPPLPPRGERRQPRFAASRHPLTTVVRPCAARCCSTMPRRWRRCVRSPRPSGTSGWTHRPCGRLPNVNSPLAQGSRRSTGRRAAPGLDRANGLAAAAHGSGSPRACAICRHWLRDSASAGSRTVAVVSPSTRRAVRDTLRSSTSRTRANSAIVCVFMNSGSLEARGASLLTARQFAGQPRGVRLPGGRRPDVRGATMAGNADAALVAPAGDGRTSRGVRRGAGAPGTASRARGWR